MNVDSLSDNEYDIYKYLETHDVSKMTAKQIAAHFYVGRSMIYRVLKKMGYATFSEYKYAVSRKTNENNELFELNVEHLYTNITFDDLNGVIKSIETANHIYIFATDATLIASHYLARQITNLGYFALAVEDPHDFDVRKEQFQKGDIVICISNSGENYSIIPRLKDMNVPLISITHLGSKLAEISNFSILFDFEDYRYENPFDRENLFPIFVILQRLLISLKKVSKKPARAGKNVPD